MNLHLMLYEKVVDHFITVCDKVSKKKSRYIIYDGASKTNSENLVNHNLAEFIEFDSPEFKQFAKSIPQNANLYIHYLSNQMIRFINSDLINEDIKIYWFFWQGDGYNRLMNDEEIFGTTTKQCIYDIRTKDTKEHKFKFRDIHRYLKNYLTTPLQKVDFGKQWCFTVCVASSGR